MVHDLCNASYKVSWEHEPGIFRLFSFFDLRFEFINKSIVQLVMNIANFHSSKVQDAN